MSHGVKVALTICLSIGVLCVGIFLVSVLVTMAVFRVNMALISGNVEDSIMLGFVIMFLLGMLTMRGVHALWKEGA